MDMNHEVDQLRELMGVDTDIALAAELGVERSTISQWRRRGQVPNRYRPMLVASPPGVVDGYDQTQRRAARRAVYGDGEGRFILAAALAFTPPAELEFTPEISAGNLGWARESRILSVTQVVLEVCKELFGKPRCETEVEYIRLINALETEVHTARIARALTVAAIGEL